MLKILTAFDLFQKLEYNWKNVKTNVIYPDYDYSLIDAVITANHLFEWYIKDDTISFDDKIKCINLLNPFKKLYDVSSDFKNLYKKLNKFPQLNTKQYYVRQLCNKVKHFNKKEIEHEEKEILSTCGNMYAGQFTSLAGYFKRFKYYIQIDEKEIDIEDILSTLIDSWQSIFNISKG